MRTQLAEHVSRETLERLEIFVDLLSRWNPKINLISPKTLPDVWERHIADSVQVFELVTRPPLSWVDLGSGGGFPGAVVAVLAAEKAPNCTFTLIESDQRKSAFLRAVARETGAGFSVIDQRIEEVEPLSAAVVSARALAPLSELLAYVKRHLALSGSAYLQKGRNADKEVTDALERWRFDCKTHPSKTDREAVILEIGDIERV